MTTKVPGSTERRKPLGVDGRLTDVQIPQPREVSAAERRRAVTLPVLIVIYFVVVVPAGWLLRVALSPEPAPKGRSFWREPEAPDHDPRMPY